ncbi:hypothetical protein TNCV_3691671 [Trichonephila clavipes]|nr:hypothetical protein TNCV_3691671 [Trichonephila clavipes]
MPCFSESIPQSSMTLLASNGVHDSSLCLPRFQSSDNTQGIDSGRSCSRIIFQSPFLKTTAESLQFLDRFRISLPAFAAAGTHSDIAVCFFATVGLLTDVSACLYSPAVLMLLLVAVSA